MTPLLFLSAAAGAVCLFISAPLPAAHAQQIPVLPTPPASSAPLPATVPPGPPTPDEAALLGQNIQRTMRLLANSTPSKRNKVRILFYGQSITEQDWSKQVASDLRRRFPNADLEIENRAIGGFASQKLIRSAEQDLYPFYPDLLIFHVYGGNTEYDEIIHRVRSRTTSEVLMQTDHVTQWPPAVPDDKTDKGMWWDNLMNTQFLPGIAQKYGCGLAQIRNPWLRYLKENHLDPPALLKDGVHLNDKGNALMAALVSRNLVYRPDLPPSADKAVLTLPVRGKDWQSGKYTLPFTGNRLDVLLAPPKNGANETAFEVRIDSKKPSEFPGCYAVTRPQPGPWSPLTVTEVGHDAPLLVEDWTLKVTSVGADGKTWAYDLRGSMTGADGSGTSDKAFASPSGRVKIAPDAFFRTDAPLAVGYQIHWKVVPLFADTVLLPAKGESLSVTLAQGLPNSPHVLELTAAPPPASKTAPTPIAGVRVYCPPVK